MRRENPRIDLAREIGKLGGRYRLAICSVCLSLEHVYVFPITARIEMALHEVSLSIGVLRVIVWRQKLRTDFDAQ
jgi:hypothetical protein